MKIKVEYSESIQISEGLRTRSRERFSNNPEYRSEYLTWKSMRARCLRKSHYAYKDYGGRGIKVCKRWESFKLFLDDMGKKPSSKHSLDRFPNNDGHYEPGNCRWAPPGEQQKNRRSNTWIEHNGVKKIRADWAREVGASPQNMFANKKKTFAERYEQFKNGGGYPVKRYEYNGKNLKIKEWADVFNVTDRSLRLYLENHTFEESYTHYTK